MLSFNMQLNNYCEDGYYNAASNIMNVLGVRTIDEAYEPLEECMKTEK